MLIKCSECGTPVPKGWLFLGLPWSKHKCPECGSVFAGTFLRSLYLAVATGFLGYFLIGAIKGKTNPLFVVPFVVVTLVVLFCDLPSQIKRIDSTQEPDGNGSPG